MCADTILKQLNFHGRSTDVRMYVRKTFRTLGGDARYDDKRLRNVSAAAATDTCNKRLHTHTSNTHKEQFSMRCSIHGKVSRREDKSSKWLHPASPPMKTITLCYFAAGVDAAMLEIE